MPAIALQQVSSKYARENARRTLDKPVAIRFIAKYLEPSLSQALTDSCPDGTLFIWGAKRERTHQTLKLIERNSVFLFRRGQTVFRLGVVIEMTDNPDLAEALWGKDTDGQTWANVFLFSKVRNVNLPAARANELLGRSTKDNWQGLVVLPIVESDRTRAFFAKELGAS